MPWGRYTTEISDPGQRRSVLLETFDTPKKLLGLTTGGEEVSRPHEVTNFPLDNLQNTRDFLKKLICKKQTTKEESSNILMDIQSIKMTIQRGTKHRLTFSC
ncbi:hypothetical protein KY285_008304 [Solanum tuberosum]|nr:hypothetical protein KY289_008741 [Solanum tuberosum]KAH0746647.1 hypothetical protein KY285_008304 [Solanum tuberosum]